MEVYNTIVELRERLNAARAEGKAVGLVGTSGAMHVGHQSLIRRSADENDVNVLFWGGRKTDFAWKKSTFAQDRNADRDFVLAQEAGGQIIFAPPGQEIFHRRPMTKVTLPDMSTGVPHLEDPAHLDLIALAMCKLWNMVGPCRVYFGEKDWQQLAMFTRMADDLNYPVEVLGCPTIREDSGLAFSSRNSQLTEEEHAKAPVFYRALCACRDAAIAGVRKASELEKVFKDTIGKVAEVRYFAPVVGETMTPLDEMSGSVRLLASVQLGAVRLLDNIGFEIPA